MTRTPENKECRDVLHELTETVSRHGADSVEVEQLLDALIEDRSPLIARVVISKSFFAAVGFFFVMVVGPWTMYEVHRWIFELLS